MVAFTAALKPAPADAYRPAREQLDSIITHLRSVQRMRHRDSDSRYIGQRHEQEREEDISRIMKKTPKFKNEDEERDFWSKEDSTNNIDWTKAKREILSNLKPSVKTISLRLPETMLEGLKLIANKRDIPYQSLIKVILAERIEEELKLLR